MRRNCFKLDRRSPARRLAGTGIIFREFHFLTACLFLRITELLPLGTAVLHPVRAQATGALKPPATKETKPNNVTLCFRRGHAVINLSSPGSEYEHSPTERPYFDLFPGCLEIFPQVGLPLKLFLALKSNLFPLNGKGKRKRGAGGVSAKESTLY